MEEKKLEDNKEVMREEVREKFLKKVEKKRNKEKIDSHEQSMKDSQGEPSYSGSSNNAPGSIEHSKKHTNMDRGNY